VQDDLVCGLLRINFVQVPRSSQSLCYASKDALLQMRFLLIQLSVDSHFKTLANEGFHVRRTKVFVFHKKGEGKKRAGGGGGGKSATSTSRSNREIKHVKMEWSVRKRYQTLVLFEKTDKTLVLYFFVHFGSSNFQSK
jgi:hypothetical protein